MRTFGGSGVATVLAFVAFAPACPSARAAGVDVPPGAASAVFAGGCFWCMESDFEKLSGSGVLAVLSGYAGGPEQHPRYEDVSAHRTGHAEVVKVIYDPKKIRFEALVAYFFRHVDPTQSDGQFCDVGRQYRSAVFFSNDLERTTIEAERDKAQRALDARAGATKRRIVTEIVALDVFWPAENYHQDFYRKQPGQYARYRNGCGRDARIAELWGATDLAPH